PSVVRTMQILRLAPSLEGVAQNAGNAEIPGLTPNTRETRMKSASYEASIRLVPEDDPLANMPEEAGRKRPIVTVRLRTDSGIEGIGVTLYGGRLTRSLHSAVGDFRALGGGGG